MCVDRDPDGQLYTTGLRDAMQAASLPDRLIEYFNQDTPEVQELNRVTFPLDVWVRPGWRACQLLPEDFPSMLIARAPR